MKKAKQLGYAPLPGNHLRSTSPGMERAPSGGVLGRRGVSPAGEAGLRRPVGKAPAKVVAPGQVSRPAGAEKQSSPTGE